MLEMVVEVGAAGGALCNIPVPGVATIGAAPPSLVLLEPRIDTDRLLAAEVVQHLAVVGKPVVVEIGNQMAGEIGAPGAPFDPLRGSAVPDIALAAGGGPDPRQAAVTLHLLDPHRMTEVSGKPLSDEFDEMGIVSLHRRADYARPTVEPARSGKSPGILIVTVSHSILVYTCLGGVASLLPTDATAGEVLDGPVDTAQEPEGDTRGV